MKRTGQAATVLRKRAAARPQIEHFPARRPHHSNNSSQTRSDGAHIHMISKALG